MKNTALILAFIMCFVSVNGFSLGRKDKEVINKIQADIVDLKKSQDDTAKTLKELNQTLTNNEKTRQSNDKALSGETMYNDKLIPITWETAKEFENDLDKLDFCIDRNLTLIPNEQRSSSGLVKGGKIVDNDEKNLSEEKLVISNSTLVKTAGFSLSSRDKASIEIFFPEQSALLKFVKNTQNCFELDADSIKITKNAKNYTVDERGILLCIYDERNHDNRTSLLGQGRAYNQQNNGAFSLGIHPPIPEDILVRNGQRYPYLTQSAVVEYMYMFKNSHGRSYRDIEAIIGHYIREAKTRNINSDIAIAQMWHATQSLTNRTLWNNCNYANLSTSDIRWNGKFRMGSREGVTAHIVHLLGYASIGPVRNSEVDPRFRLLADRRGKGDTLRKLCSLWVAKEKSKDYENSLRNILKDLYVFQEHYNNQQRILAASR
jgi:hypothetical protein